MGLTAALESLQQGSGSPTVFSRILHFSRGGPGRVRTPILARTRATPPHWVLTYSWVFTYDFYLTKGAPAENAFLGNHRSGH